jgi:hypothetical protein
MAAVVFIFFMPLQLGKRPGRFGFRGPNEYMENHSGQFQSVPMTLFRRIVGYIRETAFRDLKEPAKFIPAAARPVFGKKVTYGI